MSGIAVFTQVGPNWKVSASVVQVATGSGTLGGVLIVTTHTLYNVRVKRYDGNRDEVMAALVTAGFDKYGEAVGNAGQVLNQPLCPAYVLQGRRAPSDPTWGFTLDAVYAALQANKKLGGVGYLLCETYDEGDQRAIAAWASAKGILYGFTTPSMAVRTNLPGSLEKLIQADGSLCFMIAYDPALESNASAPFTPTVLPPGTNTWNIPPGSVVAINQDEDTPFQVVWNAEKAFATAAAGPYNGESGWKIDYSFDGGATFSLLLDAAAAEMIAPKAPVPPYVLADGQDVEIFVNGVAVPWVVTAANYGGNPAVATATQMMNEANTFLNPAGATATDTGGVFAIHTSRRGTGANLYVGSNTTNAWRVATGLTTNTVYKGTGNVADVDAINASELDALATKISGTSDASEVVGGDTFRLESAAYGSGATVSIKSTSTTLFRTALGGDFTAPDPADFFGSGDAANSGLVTPQEVYNKILAVFAAIVPPPVVPTVVIAGSVVTITGTKGVGRDRTLYLVGPLADILGIAGTWYGDGVAQDWAAAAMIGARAGLDLAAAPPGAGHLTWHAIPLNGVWGQRSLTNNEMERLNNTQHVNCVPVIDEGTGAQTMGGLLVIAGTGNINLWIDQFIATKWFAEFLAFIMFSKMMSISKSLNSISFFNESAYSGFIIGCVEDAETTAVNSRALAFVDTEAPTLDKPTGVEIPPRISLSPAQVNTRSTPYRVKVQLSGYLHGAFATVELFP